VLPGPTSYTADDPWMGVGGTLFPWRHTGTVLGFYTYSKIINFEQFWAVSNTPGG